MKTIRKIRRSRPSTPLPPRLRPPTEVEAEFETMFPHSRPILSLRDMRQAFNVSVEHLRRLVQHGYLLEAPAAPRYASRRVYRVTRASAAAFYAQRFGVVRAQ
jgi:hypothetical protein